MATVPADFGSWSNLHFSHPALHARDASLFNCLFGLETDTACSRYRLKHEASLLQDFSYAIKKRSYMYCLTLPQILLCLAEVGRFTGVFFFLVAGLHVTFVGNLQYVANASDGWMT
jgi:hypothetical protein